MKVLHIDTGREWRGGQQQVLYLTRGLEERGVTSVVATPKGSPLFRKLRAQDLPVIEIPYHSHYAPRTIRSVQRILADRTWNVMHMHTAHAHTLGFLSLKLPPPRAFQKPTFVVSRRVDFVPHRDPVTRLKYTMNNQSFVCVSEAVRQILIEYGIPGRSAFVVRSGVTMPARGHDNVKWRNKRRDTLGVPKDVFLLGAIGHLVPHKGHRHLIKALSLVRKTRADVHLVLIGEGELEKELRTLVEEEGLTPFVHFAGYRPSASKYVAAFDLYVHPSVEEGLGTSILDAGAGGVPVVATRAGGIPETIQDGVTGLLVPPADAEELARAILELADDPARRTEMAIAAREWVRTSRSDERMVEETLNVYRTLLMRGA
ncbi:MAG: glycosyltransferase family 4 protein [Candidatus Eisenbacteria bacterium]